MDLAIIIVSWNTRDLLAQCLRSVFAYPPDGSFEVWVVDNASHDGSAEMVRQQFPKVRLIANAANVGFARANNQAIEQSRSQFVMFLNSDTLIQPAALSNMLAFLNAHPEAGVVGAYLTNADGTPQLCFGSLPTLLGESAMAWGLNRHWPISRLYGYTPNTLREYQPTGWVLGAAMLMRREVLTRVGPFDESYFMYSEEIDLCYRVTQAGFKNYVLNTAYIIHLGGQSTSLAAASMKAELFRSKTKYFRKHFGPSAAHWLDLNFAASITSKRYAYKLMKSPQQSQLWSETWQHYKSADASKRSASGSAPARNDLVAQALDAALDWLVAAWHATDRKGVSAGYDRLRRRWKPAYPETTGYIIPTLLDCAQLMPERHYTEMALELANYELSVQGSDGSIPTFCGRPVVFDTGQVIFGWLRAHAESHDERYLSAAIKAADWLCAVQDADGAWRKHQHLNLVKVIDTRVALALLEVARQTKVARYEEAARRNLDWATRQQRTNGWLDYCALRPNMLPVTHTLAYTTEGLLESGLLLEEPRYVQTAQKTADVLLNLQRADGAVPGAFDAQWNGARWSCLTGNVQLALIWYRLYELSSDEKYRKAAANAIVFVREKQNRTSKNPAVRGAIAGSWPIWGPYERLKFPNWAVKFFIDALLAERHYA